MALALRILQAAIHDVRLAASCAMGSRHASTQRAEHSHRAPACHASTQRAEEPYRPPAPCVPGSRDDRLAHWFSLLDRDQDGMVGQDDMTKYLQAAGKFLLVQPSEPMMRGVQDHWDMQWPLLRLLSPQPILPASLTLSDWVTAFKVILSDGSTSHTFASLPLSTQRMIDGLFDQQDLIRDGVLDYQEYRMYWGVMAPPPLTNAQARHIHDTLTEGGKFQMDRERFRDLFVEYLFNDDPSSPGRYVNGPLGH